MGRSYNDLFVESTLAARANEDVCLRTELVEHLAPIARSVLAHQLGLPRAATADDLVHALVVQPDVFARACADVAFVERVQESALVDVAAMELGDAVALFYDERGVVDATALALSLRRRDPALMELVVLVDDLERSGLSVFVRIHDAHGSPALDPEVLADRLEVFARADDPAHVSKCTRVPSTDGVPRVLIRRDRAESVRTSFVSEQSFVEWALLEIDPHGGCVRGGATVGVDLNAVVDLVMSAAYGAPTAYVPSPDLVSAARLSTFIEAAAQQAGPLCLVAFDHRADNFPNMPRVSYSVDACASVAEAVTRAHPEAFSPEAMHHVLSFSVVLYGICLRCRPKRRGDGFVVFYTTNTRTPEREAAALEFIRDRYGITLVRPRRG